MLVFEERGKLEYPEKPLGEKERTSNKLNPRMASNELPLQLRNIQCLETFKISIKTFSQTLSFLSSEFLYLFLICNISL